MGLPPGSTAVPPTGMAPPPGGVMTGYRCGSNTSSSSGRGSINQHASLPRHFSNRTTMSSGGGTGDPNSPLSEVPIINNGLPSVSAHIPMQHHNLGYNTANKSRQQPYSTMNSNSNYYYQRQQPPNPQYNSHYRGHRKPPLGAPLPGHQHPAAVQQLPPNAPNDYGILKFNANGNVGKEIDV